MNWASTLQPHSRARPMNKHINNNKWNVMNKIACNFGLLSVIRLFARLSLLFVWRVVFYLLPFSGNEWKNMNSIQYLYRFIDATFIEIFVMCHLIYCFWIAKGHQIEEKCVIDVKCFFLSFVQYMIRCKTQRNIVSIRFSRFHLIWLTRLKALKSFLFSLPALQNILHFPIKMKITIKGRIFSLWILVKSVVTLFGHYHQHILLNKILFCAFKRKKMLFLWFKRREATRKHLSESKNWTIFLDSNFFFIHFFWITLAFRKWKSEWEN